MIGKTPPPGTLVAIPLRDALRGAERVWDVTEELLEPVAAILPPALATSLKSALDQAERSALAGLHDPPAHADIARAAHFLTGEDTAVASAEAFARILAYAAERTAASTGGSFLASEGVAVSATLALSGGRTGADRAADIVLALRRAFAVGSVPGTPIRLTADVARGVDVCLFAAALWMLAAREPTEEKEVEVFRLALALTRTLSDQVSEWSKDSDALAHGLRDLSEHV